MYAHVERLARLFALMGGAVLSVLVVMTCLSIVGRLANSILHSDLIQSAVPGLASALIAAGIGPINGDFELVEAGMAFAIFAFLPLCQLRGAHASVDVFTTKLPAAANGVLQMVIDFIFAAVLVLIAVQLFDGMQSKRLSGQTTFLLQFPLWWAYAACLSGAVVAALISVYVSAIRVVAVATGRNFMPNETEPDT